MDIDGLDIYLKYMKFLSLEDESDTFFTKKKFY